MAFNQNASYGRALMDAVAEQIPTFGRILVVVPLADSALWSYQTANQVMLPDSEGRLHYFTTIEDAYTEAQSGNNDVICLSGNSTHTLSAGLTVSKNRVHFFGFDGGDRLTEQGAKITNPSTDTTAFVVKVTGTRCSFRNIKFLQSSTNAAALTVVQFGGDGTLVKNCSFIFTVADNLGSTSANEVVMGEDSGTFINCQFGSDTLLTTAARAVMLIKIVTTSQEFKSNVLKECRFKISSSSATAYLLKVNSTTDVLFENMFDRCLFSASVDSAGGIALTNAVTSATGLVKGTLNFYQPGSFNCTNFSANDSSGFKVAAPVASTNAFEAVTPA